MALGDTQLANLALSLLGGGVGDTKQLTDIEDQNETAAWCKELLPIAKELAWSDVEPHTGNSYLPGTSLGGDQPAVEHVGFDYAYLLPANCLLLVRLVDADLETVAHAFHDGYIHTDALPDDFSVQGLFSLLAPEKVRIHVNRCVAYQLAIALCGPILKSDVAAARRRELLEEYEKIILPRAIAKNLQENHPDGEEDETVWGREE